MGRKKLINSTLDLPEDSSKKVGYVLVATDLFDPEENQEATDLFLDFLSDCTIHERTTVSAFDEARVRLLIEHDDLSKVLPFSAIPYYNVMFNPDGTYEFKREYVTEEEKIDLF